MTKAPFNYLTGLFDQHRRAQCSSAGTIWIFFPSLFIKKKEKTAEEWTGDRAKE